MLSEKASAILWVCGVGFSLGLGCAIAAARKTRQMRKAAQWPSVWGKIIESTTWSDRNGDHFRIRYEFVVGQEIVGSAMQGRGHSHCFRTIIGTTPRLSGSWFWQAARMHAFVSRYPAGQEVEVFYDPQNPKRNCLDREDRAGIGTLWGCAAFMLIVSSLLAWRFAAAFP